MIAYLLLFIFKDPPDEFPVIVQIPEGPINTGQSVSLVCYVYGGNPIALLTWNCTDHVMSNSTTETAFITTLLHVTKHTHGVVCACSTSHVISSYKHIVYHQLNVICK